MSQPPKADLGGPSNDDRTWGLLVHLSPLVVGFVGPLVIWLIYKDKSAFVADQAREALNFQLAMMLACLVLGVTIIGLLLIPFVAIGGLIYSILAAVEANKGVQYRYPYTIRFITE